jgi:Holin of 3TMs, for gene-transfer release
MADKVEDKKEDKPQEDWMTKKWRPMMAMMYMLCCLCDFAIFPIMFTVVQFWETQAANDAFRQWVPITLQGGGLFHVAMGAVLGVSAYGRTQEKLGGAAGGSAPAPAGLPTQALPAPVTTAPVVVQAPVMTTPVPVRSEPTYIPPQEPVAPVVAGFNGKAAPPPAPQPLI